MKGLVVAGVMSGTSADGVDVAVCRIVAGADGEPRVKVLRHEGFRYPKAVREAVLRAMEGGAMRGGGVQPAELAAGRGVCGLCGEGVCRGGREFRARGSTGTVATLGLVGVHGQTVYHQALAARYLGTAVRCTWQMGEAAVDGGAAAVSGGE